MSGKWLELLKEIAPRVIRVAVLHHPENPAWPGYLRVMETVAPLQGIQLTTRGVHDAAEIEQVFAALASESRIGLIVAPDAVTTTQRERIVSLAARHRLPAVYPLRSYAMSGGLMSYGPDLPGQARQALTYVDRILKGAKPADMPVQLPTTYEFVINLKTARTLGLDVSPSIRLRATEVIE